MHEDDNSIDDKDRIVNGKEMKKNELHEICDVTVSVIFQSKCGIESDKIRY